jgi:hypothetical protein
MGKIEQVICSPRNIKKQKKPSIKKLVKFEE